MTNRYEPFKQSKHSICQSCSNINGDCFEFTKLCNTDAKLGHSYVSKCSQYNKDGLAKYESSIVSTDASSDSRVEMMGGGYKHTESDLHQ